MSYHAHDAYLESRILSADPIELTRMLFQACTEAVRDARRHLQAGQIRQRSNAVSKACEILFELDRSLDHTRGGEISARLGLLYDYMQRRLIEANCQQTETPLAEVLKLLTTLSEGWDGIAGREATPAEAQNSWVCETAAAGCPAGSWSF